MFGHWSPTGRLARILVALVTLMVAPTAALGVDQGPWTATAVMGKAWFTLPARMPQALLPGAKIRAGSEIVTERHGRATLRRGGTTMTLAPASHTLIPLDSDRGGRTRVFQRDGSLTLHLDKRRLREFRVETSVLTASARGAAFTVDVGVHGASVRVSDARVRVRSLADRQGLEVGPGQSAVLGGDPDAALRLVEGAGRREVRLGHEIDATRLARLGTKPQDRPLDAAAARDGGGEGAE